MSERLRERFRLGKAEGRPLVVGYVTAGFPERANTVPILLAMEAGGADVIELGVPFTDPLADGATIQHANDIALTQGVSLRDCFAFVADARSQGLQAPVIFMGYYNPILAHGEARACRDGAAAGIDGWIVIDLPPDEGPDFLVHCKANDLSFVPLVTPTSEEPRMDILAGAADGFLYCVSVTGSTGKGNIDTSTLPEFLARVRRHSDLPIVVGFGITRPEHVAAIGKIADGAAVGSSIISVVERAAKGERAAAVRAFVAEMSGRG